MPKSPKTSEKTPKKTQQPPEPETTPSVAAGTGITSVQLITVLTVEGLQGFEETLEASTPSLPVLKKTHALIEGSGERGAIAAMKVEALAAIDKHCDARGISVVPSRGRQPPGPGERRRYKVQQLADGGPFLRLAMSSLGCAKGDVVHVDFLAGEVRVRPAKPHEQADVDDDDDVVEG